LKLPRDWSGEELARRLVRIGYAVTRQSGSHMRLTHSTTTSQHHVTVPRHAALRAGTLAAILDDVASNLSITREQLLDRLL